MPSIISTSDPEAVTNAVNTLIRGGVIAIPTDTVYGLACSVTNVSAISKLYDIKARDSKKPVAICLGREEDVYNWVSVKHLPKLLLTTLLPGPVTLILKSTHSLDKSLIHNGKVGIRIPDSPFIRNVANLLGNPIALTSANVSKQPSSVNVEEFKCLWERLEGVYDGGNLGVGESNRGASTVVDLSENGLFAVVRKGIAFRETVEVLKHFGLKEQA